MKIVITGANGFVGAALCRYFHRQGHQVTATGRQAVAPANLLNYANYIPADIVNPVKEFEADVCIHAAGLASDTADYNRLYLNHVQGTANVLDAAKNCRYFIFISSSSVYDFNDQPATESDADIIAPLSDYGKTKLMAEQLVHANIPGHQQRLILRPRAIYGIGDQVLLPRLLPMLKYNRIFCPIAPQIQTSATHVDHIAYATSLFMAQTTKLPLQLYNIADAEIYGLREMAVKTLTSIEDRLKVLNIPPAWLTVPKMLSPVALRALTTNSILDISPIQKALAYRPKTNFNDTVAEIGEWVRKIGGKKNYLRNLSAAPWLVSL